MRGALMLREGHAVGVVDEEAVDEQLGVPASEWPGQVDASAKAEVARRCVQCSPMSVPKSGVSGIREEAYLRSLVGAG